MTTFEELFNQSVLAVIAPEASLGFPSQNDDFVSWQDWLSRLEVESTDRKLAFFDENLNFLLTLRFEHPLSESEPDPKKPPVQLLSFLAHLQISYDASYISSIARQPTSPLPPEINRPPIPPRHQSMPNRNRPSPLAPPHPSIFPPHTPNPIPSTTENDRQYVQAQGTPLRSGVWGDATPVSAPSPSEEFALLWSESDRSWVAIFKMTVQVSFMPTRVPNPLLCLTASATLREKPVTTTPIRQALTALIEAAGGIPSSLDPSSPMKASGDEDDEDASDITGMEEINLLEGLTLGPTFAFAKSPLVLSSTRLGTSMRQQAFALPSTSPPSSSPLRSAMTPSTSRPGASHPTLRKSFRKTLRTVSGFRVRMRTVFVPYFMLPQTSSQKQNKRNGRQCKTQDAAMKDDSDADDDLELIRDRELLEAGNEEHTVVLCVEVENSGESSAGFAVESVNVTVGGEGAKTQLIGWGDFDLSAPDKVFPLLIGPEEQYNLLYAVAFMRTPETDEFSLARGRGLPGAPPVQQLQRAVTIILNGRPYEQLLIEETPVKGKKKHDHHLLYPTHAFPSRWNCVLDLSSQAPSQNINTPGFGGPLVSLNEAMPTPASPFPSATSRPTLSRPQSAFVTPTLGLRPNTPGSGASTPVSVVAGNKRFTFSAIDTNLQIGGDSSRLRPPPSPMNYRSDTSLLNPANQQDSLAQSGFPQSKPSTPSGGLSANPIAQNRASYIPPSLTVPTLNRTPTTTYGPLSPPLPSLPRSQSFAFMQEEHMSSPVSYEAIPPTPAYPAFPTSPLPPTPHWQGPMSNLQSGAVGPSIEIRREKGPNAMGIPPTPGPRVGAGTGFMQMQMQGEAALRGSSTDGPREPIVVSVGLLQRADGDEVHAGALGRIYPLDRFTLDIFVFNQSSWTRRFEVSYPDRRRQRRDQMHRAFDTEGTIEKSLTDSPGIIPLENRVRVGPLLPSTCQSVRMDFLALTPGVHSVDILTLTDIQSGFSMTLRSVIDVVVHEQELIPGKAAAEVI